MPRGLYVCVHTLPTSQVLKASAQLSPLATMLVLPCIPSVKSSSQIFFTQARPSAHTRKADVPHFLPRLRGFTQRLRVSVPAQTNPTSHVLVSFVQSADLPTILKAVVVVVGPAFVVGFPVGSAVVWVVGGFLEFLSGWGIVTALVWSVQMRSKREIKRLRCAISKRLDSRLDLLLRMANHLGALCWRKSDVREWRA